MPPFDNDLAQSQNKLAAAERRPNPLRKVIASSILFGCLTLAAQEKGMWRAASSNAKSITGDIALSDQKITINFLSFTMVRVRALEKSELSAAFDADANAPGIGSLYRMDIPSSRKFLKKNSLCGAEDTEWMATYAAGRSLQLAFFSGQKPPVFTLDALANSSDTCGIFSYVY
jgi:hypothetical protein